MVHPGSDSLRRLFGELVFQSFGGALRIRDRDLMLYLTDLLARFAHRDRLYAVRDAAGRPLESVAEMLLQSDVLLGAASFDREREVHKHIGDFTLFVAGVWPEWEAMIHRSGGADSLLDYRRCGKHSYYVASCFQHGPYAAEAPLLRQLSEEFELCEVGLHLVRDAMDRLGMRPDELG